MMALAGLLPQRVSWHVLITSWPADNLTLATEAALGLAAVAYLAGVRRLRRRSRHWPVLTSACALAGLAFLFIPIGTGVAYYDDTNFPDHVVQHILLMMVAPPLIVLGRPGVLMTQALRGRARRVAVAVFNSRLLKGSGGVVGFIAYNAIMWLYFFTPVFRLCATHPNLHDSAHAIFVLVGLVFWQGVINPRRSGGELSHPRRVFAIVASMPMEMYLGFALRAVNRPLGPGTTAASVHAGGELFWYLSMLVSGFALSIALAQWALADERAARRFDTAHPLPDIPLAQPVDRAKGVSAALLDQDGGEALGEP